jgi:N-acetylneuraminic acid mutarotase
LMFSKLADMPDGLIFAGSVSDGENIYCINGIRPYTAQFPSTGVLRYEPKTDQWSVLTNKLTPKIQTMVAYVPSMCKIYVMGGTIVGARTNSLFRGIETVDVNTGEVERLKITNPLATTYGGAAVWNNNIYLFGGSRLNGMGVSSFYKFDTSTQQFTELADMPEYVQTTGAIVNGVLYTFGGFNPVQHYNSTQISAYNIKTNTWTKAGTLPETLSANAIATYGKLIFIVGNYSDLRFLGYYDTETQQFTKLNSNMLGRRHAGAGIASNQLIIFGGNTTTTGMALNSTQGVDISSIK